MADGVEDDAELRVVLRLQLVESANEIGMSGEYLPKSNERSHNLDIDGHRPIAAKNAGKHGDALFGEGLWPFAATAPT